MVIWTDIESAFRQ